VRDVALDKVGACLKRRSALFGLWTQFKLIILAGQAEAGFEGRCVRWSPVIVGDTRGAS
jgi:hypothetical protein